MTTTQTISETQALRLRAGGVVQGVGFRPFVYRLARKFGLKGWVRNDLAGVLIHIEGSPAQLEVFREQLVRQAPTAEVEVSGQSVPVAGHTWFRILPSEPADNKGHLRVPPDRARCDACRQEVFDANDHRHGYPFTTCTNCGPRYSILERLPYDRPQTGMAGFPLCPACQKEYDDPECRRFRAETIACSDCGPRVWLTDGRGREMAEGREAVRAAAGLLRLGQIVALQGLGGFQLLVRADQPEAVRRLRQRKRRPSKPLAVMVRDLAAAQRIVRIDAAEQRLLKSPENPIVLLDRLPGSEARVAAEVAPRLGWIGLLLPTTPLHDLLLAECASPVIATSGNRSEEPIEKDHAAAWTNLAEVADAFLVHDRPILRRADDSVVRVVAGQPIMLRLARGYAPCPLANLECWLRTWPMAPRPILAVGGQQKSAIALWTGKQAILSPHIGDLDSLEARAAFSHLIQSWSALYGCRPQMAACDFHPDYFSTRWAEEQGLPLVRVQHHHAHAAAVMAEHGLMDAEVLAFTWDGTGHGTDGTVWGGEVLRAKLDRFVRVISLQPFRLPGGEAAIREPGRVALALLAQALGEAAVLSDIDLFDRLQLKPAEARTLLRMSARDVCSPWTTSVGRLFDAVAALLLPVGRVSYEGEAAVWLESLADPAIDNAYPVEVDATGRADASRLLQAIQEDVRHGSPATAISGRFHQWLAAWAAFVAERHPGLPVVLGGGCFQNRLLLERTKALLERAGRRVYHASRVPPGDGGLAVGQLAVALAHARSATGE